MIMKKNILKFALMAATLQNGLVIKNGFELLVSANQAKVIF